MAGTEAHKAILEMAYTMAAREMCRYCAHLNDPELIVGEWLHVVGNVGENRTYYECYAGPIHRLIGKLNEAQP